MVSGADCEAESEVGIMDTAKIKDILFSSCDHCDGAVYTFPVVKKAICSICGKDKLIYYHAEVPQSQAPKAGR